MPEHAVGAGHAVPIGPLDAMQIIHVRRVGRHIQGQRAGLGAGSDKSAEMGDPLDRVRVLSHERLPDDIAQSRGLLAGDDIDHADHTARGGDEGYQAPIGRLADLHLGQVAPDILLPEPRVVVALEGPVDGIFVPGGGVAGEDPDCFGFLVGDGEVVG